MLRQAYLSTLVLMPKYIMFFINESGITFSFVNDGYSVVGRK